MKRGGPKRDGPPFVYEARLSSCHPVIWGPPWFESSSRNLPHASSRLLLQPAAPKAQELDLAIF